MAWVGSRGAALLAVLATAVAVGSGLLATGAQADATGTITGRATASANGAALSGIDVEVYTGQVAGQFVGATTTAADGTYALAVAPSSDGYSVCFNVVGTPYQSSGPGLADQCFDGQPFGGPFPNPFGQVQLPGTQTPVPVTGGQTVGGIDAALDVVLPQTPVTVTASGVGVLRSVLAGSLTFRASVRDPAGGTGVGGLAVTFTTPAVAGAPVTCTTTTAATGTAVCRLPAVAALRLRVPGTVRATTPATAAHTAGSGSARVVLV